MWDNSFKVLYIVTAHLDDFELSCLAYLFKHVSDYKKIYLLVSSNNNFKDSVTKANIEEIQSNLGMCVEYKNFNFQAQKLQLKFDELKHEIYSTIDWHDRFDVLTHTNNDLHTDHHAISTISMGLFKYCEKYIEFYSPSSKNFSPNYFIPMSDDLYQLKNTCCLRYDIQKDESYTKMGYYLEDHRNLGKLYTYENHVKYTSEYFEVYNIKKHIVDKSQIIKRKT